MLIVHVGLAKTATTTLQRSVFPLLSSLKNLTYNPHEFIDLRRRKFIPTENDYIKFKYFSEIEKKILLSAEGLVDYNPHYWEQAANRNLSLFGKNASIIITIREPISYITSLYQQLIHEGNIINPDEFFVSNYQYKILRPWLSDRKLLRFDKDAFDLEFLIKLYKERFENVFVVTLENIGSMNFLNDIFNLSDIERVKLQNNYKKAKKVMFLIHQFQ